MIPISYNLRSMAQRKATTGATIFGVGMVVWLFASAFMFNAGVNESLQGAGEPNNVLVLRKGSDAEMASGIEDPQIGTILARDEVAKLGANATAMGVGELVAVIAIDKKGTNGISNMTIRGVPSHVMQFRPEVKIVAGRPAKPGTNEVIVGSAIRGRFVGVDLGQSFELRKNRPAQVVGVFSANGKSYESEVWGDVDIVRNAFGREGVVSSVRARLSSPSKYDAFKAGVEADKTLGLEVMREADYYEKQAEGQSALGIIGIVIAILCSFGAMIGAAITMNAAVANRQREIGTLRALGFSRFTILISFVLETLILAGLGCIIGVLGAMLMSFASFGSMNMVTWSEVVIRFRPTGGIIIGSVFFAMVVGLIGGLIPAIRAALVSPLEAMRG
jgi:putative ABC transport system permease protein